MTDQRVINQLMQVIKKSRDLDIVVTDKSLIDSYRLRIKEQSISLTILLVVLVCLLGLSLYQGHIIDNLEKESEKKQQESSYTAAGFYFPSYPDNTAVAVFNLSNDFDRWLASGVQKYKQEIHQIEYERQIEVGR